MIKGFAFVFDCTDLKKKKKKKKKKLIDLIQFHYFAITKMSKNSL